MTNKQRAIALIAAFLLTAAIPGCRADVAGVGGPVVRPVSLLPASFEPGGSLECAWIVQPSELELELRIAGARGLKAVYLDACIPGGLELDSAQFSDTLCGNGAGISLAISPQPGRVVLGQVVPNHQDAEGFSGDALIATLKLRQAAPAREASDPPTADAARTTLSLSLATGELSWLYYNPGDYDQNSEVNISDLTPLSAHFGATSGGGAFDAASVESVVDGDNNGEINISDLTTIAANFGRVCSGYKVYVSANASDVPASNGAPSSVSAMATSTVKTGNPSQVRQALQHTLASITPGAFYWVRPFETIPGSYTEGTPSTVVDVADIQNNLPPVAALDAAVSVARLGEAVLLSAGGSSDGDGTIVKYSWDPEGDGSYLPDSPETNQSFLTNYCSQAGSFNPTVKVRDDKGAESTASVALTVSLGTQHVDVIDPDTGGINFPPNIAIVDGCPAVAYVCDGDGSVRFSRATTASASTWSAPRILDTAVLGTADIAVVSSNAAIVWQSNEGLQYQRALDVQGNTWSAPVTVTANEPTYDNGLNPDIEVVGNQPAILYSDAANLLSGNTWYRRSTDTLGTTWGPEVQINLPGETGFSGCLTMTNGRPAAIYHNGPTLMNLHFASASDNVGTSFQSPLIVSSVGKMYASTTTLNHFAGDFVAIFFEAESDQLMLCRATSLDGLDWGEPEPICSAPTLMSAYCVGRNLALPMVAYYQASQGLALTVAKDPKGLAWEEPKTLVAAADQGHTPAMISVNSHPLFVYLDSSTNELLCLHFD